MTPEQIRVILHNALKVALAAEVINGSDQAAIAKVQVAMQVVAKLTDEQIEEKLRELFEEATAAYNA